MAAKIIAIANHKGGVCKTTLTTNLADAFIREGKEVLIIDLDPQANATYLAYSWDEVPSVTIEKVLDGSSSIAEAIIDKTRVEGMHLIGASLKLERFERLMQQTPFSSTALLKNKLSPVMDAYDIIIIDCPPALNYLTANALVSADLVFVPVESGSKLSLVGTDDMLNFIREAKNANPKLEFGGAILTKHDVRKKICKIMAGAVASYYETVLEAVLPPTTDMHKAQLLGQTIMQFDRDHTASRSLAAMAREILAKLGLPAKKEKDNEGKEAVNVEA